LFFCRSGLKVLFTPPEYFSFFGGRGGVYPQNLEARRSDPQKAFEPSLIKIWRTVQPVALAKEKRKKRKKTVANWLFAQTTQCTRRRIAVKVCVSGGLDPVCSSIYQSFVIIGPMVLSLWVVENRPFPLLWPLAYITACTTVQAVMREVNLLILSYSTRKTVTYDAESDLLAIAKFLEPFKMIMKF